MAYIKKAHLKDNIEAIKLAFALEREGRTATPEEQAVLRAYSGFGGIKAVLNPASSLADVARWTKSDRELFPLVSQLHSVIRSHSKDEAEYKRYFSSLKNSVLTAFYTPQDIVSVLSSELPRPVSSTRRAEPVYLSMLSNNIPHNNSYLNNSPRHSSPLNSTPPPSNHPNSSHPNSSSLVPVYPQLAHTVPK